MTTMPLVCVIASDGLPFTVSKDAPLMLIAPQFPPMEIVPAELLVMLPQSPVTFTDAVGPAVMFPQVPATVTLPS